MPSTYAHYVFGKKVYKTLPQNMRKIISGNRNAYAIGLQGPDLLFYYKPLGTNEISQQGFAMHRQMAADFLIKGRQRFQSSRSQLLLAYLFGFICHYMLDSECHPFISENMKHTNISHNEIETHLERQMLEEDGINPFQYNPASYIEPEKSFLEQISGLYGVTQKELKACLKSAKRFNGLMVCTSSLKRRVLTTMLKLFGKYEAMEGLFMKKEKNPLCSGGTAKIQQLLGRAVPKTVFLLKDFYEKIEQVEGLDKRFYRNFE